MASLQDHEFACIFPLLSDADLAALADDIEANGLREPIWLYEGKILDGRNRYRACVMKDSDHRIEEYRGKDALGFVISKNLHRRHLTESQRAMVAAELPRFQVGDNQHNGGSANLPTLPKIAEKLQVSERSVRSAQHVKDEAEPEIVEAVRAGDIPVSTAAKVADLPAKEQRKIAKSKEPAKAAREAVKKKEAKPESIVVPPVQVDEWGIPIQEHAVEVFAAVPQFNELIATLKLAQKQFNAVANMTGGKFLTLPEVSSYRRGKKAGDGHEDRFVHEGLERALNQVKNAIPTHTVCPWHYVDGKHPEDCRTCGNLNWTPVLGNNIPDMARERARKKFKVKED